MESFIEIKGQTWYNSLMEGVKDEKNCTSWWMFLGSGSIL